MGVIVSHQLPGRVRLVIHEMANQEILALRLQSQLSQTEGVIQAKCSSDTGRALIRFEETRTSAQQLVEAIEAWIVEQAAHYTPVEAVAATVESGLVIPSAMEPPENAKNRNPYLIPTVISSGLLGVLSLKRLLLGRSILAASPITFWAAAGVSIAAGYPALRRGLENLFKNRRVTPDLWLGLGTLSMAAMRENLVALSVITGLNLAMYRRYAVLDTPEDTILPVDVERHSQAMNRITMWLAPLALVLTRSPLRAMGIALAANPRPAIVSHKYRWAQAEREAMEKQFFSHTKEGLVGLSRARKIVFADESLVYGNEKEWILHPLQENTDAGKTLAVVASLLQKCDEHPWRTALIAKAKQNDRTLHTPFEVEHTQHGVRGIIQGQEVLFGNKTFLSESNVDDTDFLLEERRLRRQGYSTQIVVVDGKPLGIIGCKRSIDASWKRILDEWIRQGYQIYTLKTDRFQATRLASITPENVIEDLANGVTTIYVGREPLVQHPCLVHVSDMDCSRLPGVLKFCQEKSLGISRDLRIVKLWNLVGMAIAWVSPATAPLIGLTSDVVAMYLMAAQQSIGGAFQRVRQVQKSLSWSFPLAGRRDKAAPFRKGQEDDEAGRNGPSKQAESHTVYHSVPVSALLEHLGIESHWRLESGLSEAQVMKFRQVFGPNQLVAPTVESPILIFLRQFKELSTLILMGTAGVSFVMGERFSALCMLGILVVNALIGTWQEKRSNEIIEALKVEDDSYAKVIRDGKEQMVSTRDVVPGDLVLLEPGDKVPADIRILDAWDLEANEAMLTGESVPASKLVTELGADTPLAERSNLLFMGTTITRGRCHGLVVATGQSTEIGRLGSLMHDQEEGPTFLQTRVAAISKRFVVGAFIAAGVVAIAGLLRGIPPTQLLISSVTLAASAIPEGLPLTITVALTAGVLQMSKRKAVVKKLANLESLGRVTVICSDKTGTLTKNQMTVKELTTTDRHIFVSGNDKQLGEFFAADYPDVPVSVVEDPDLRQLVTIGMLCNNAQMGDGNSGVTGDPTETALLTVAKKANLNVDAWKRHREIPFDSATRSMGVVCKEEEQANLVCEDSKPVQRCTLFAKGAPEVILDKCTHYLKRGQVLEMTEDIRQDICRTNHEMADKALRVIAFAYKDIYDNEDEMQVKDDQLIYVGMMGMMDPPKEGVASSIAEARRLGIKPVMITGDHPLTARAIATQVGIFTAGDSVVTGNEIDRFSQTELEHAVRTASVFARVSPEHKLRIVEAYQRMGHVVAMTGDGVNDAPAIRKADVGIAMGENGTDITKGTAGIVLMEDHFHSIVEGVKGGRAIIGNIRKAMGCLLSGNLAEVLVTALSVIIGLPMPLIPLQILLMNILTDAVPAMVLATGSQTDVQPTPYKDVIDKKLYRTVLTRGAVLGLGGVGVFATALAIGIPLPLAQTMAYSSLVVGQLIQTAAWRRYGSSRGHSWKDDRVLLTATVGSWLALAATIYVPGLRAVFGTVPLGAIHWGIVLAVTGGLSFISKMCLEQFVHRENKNVIPTGTTYALAT